MNQTRKNNGFLWKIYSYIFHPVFIPLFLFSYLLYVCPNSFGSNSFGQKKSLLANIILNLVFFPAFTVLLLRKLKFIESYTMENRKERTFSIFAYSVYAFWVWAFVLYKNPANYDVVGIKTGLVIFICSSIALLCNSFYKISLHGIGAGMCLGLGVYSVSRLQADPLWIVFALLLAGTILGSRKLAGTHSDFELYSGFMCGFLMMLLVQFVF
jgi:hypothetical protein